MMYNAEAILRKVRDRLTCPDELTVEELQEMIGISEAEYEAEEILKKVTYRLAHPEGITLEELQEMVGVPVIGSAALPDEKQKKSKLTSKIIHIIRNLKPEAKVELIKILDELDAEEKKEAELKTERQKRIDKADA